MRKMKDSGIEWIGEIPEGWEVVKAKYLFAQRNEKGNSALVLLSPTQKYGVIPQSQLEGVVQVKENTDLRTFKTIHIGDFVISLRSFQGGFEFQIMRVYVPLHIRYYMPPKTFPMTFFGIFSNQMVLSVK